MTNKQLLEKLNSIDEFYMLGDAQVFYPKIHGLEEDLYKAGIVFRIEDNLICVYFEDNV